MAEITRYGHANPRRITLRVEEHPASTWHAKQQVVTPDLALDEELTRIVIDVACDETWTLSHGRELVVLRDRVAPPFPVGTFVVVRRGPELVRIGLAWASRFTVERTSRGCSIIASVQDRSSCGLVLWGRSKLSDHELPGTLVITTDTLSSLDDCVWVEPYPAPSVVCLTDHPDFDTTERLAVLAELFVQYGIKITKGVFPRSDPRGNKAEPGLDDPPYRELVRKLHWAGTEIAFHGVGPRYSAPPIEECERRCESMLEFRPTTWIDHGTGEYLFTRAARIGETSLQSLLRPIGVRNYWSYTDLWDNPMRDLSCWTARRPRDAFGDAATHASLQRHELGGPQLGYAAAHLLRNALGEQLVSALRANKLDLSTLRIGRTAMRAISVLRASPFVMYGLNGAGVGLNRDREWVFDSVLLNHPALQLRPDAIDQLAATSGLLIAHVYLSASHRYLRGGCFEHTGTRLNPAFIENIGALADAQQRRKVVTMSFAELRAHLAAFHSTAIERNASGWSVTAAQGIELPVVGKTRRLTTRGAHLVH